MWLLTLALHLALTNVLDTLFNLLGIAIFKFNFVDLGLFNTLWTLAYVLATRFSNELVDRGLFKRAMKASLALYALMSLAAIHSLASGNVYLYFLSYCLHAAATSSARLAVYTSILEYYDSSRWKSANRALLCRVLVLEGALLLACSSVGFAQVASSAHLLLLMLAATSALSVFAVPQPILLIERTMFRIERNINRMLLPVRSSLAMSFQPAYLPDRLSIYGDIVSRGFVNRATILYALFFLRLSNELLLTPLPLYLLGAGGHSLEGVLSMYGLAKVLSSIAIATLSASSISRGSVLLAALARTLSSAALFALLRNYYLVVALITLAFLSNAILDAALYSAYLETSGGYRTGSYTVTSEAASLKGSMMSGFVVMLFGPAAVILLIAASSAMFLSMARRL